MRVNQIVNYFALESPPIYNGNHHRLCRYLNGREAPWKIFELIVNKKQM